MMNVVAAVAAGVGVLLLAGCGAQGSAGSAESSEEDGEEVTEFADPTAEATDQTDTADNGSAQASVELPGLPVGGNEVVFAAPSTQCASVSTTNFDLPPGVSIVVTEFGVPPQFTVSSNSCGGPPCLGGHAFVAGGSSCEVAVTWGGEPPGDEAALQVVSAEATCADQARCEELLATVQAAAGGSIGLVVISPEEEVSPEAGTESGGDDSVSAEETTE